MPRSADLQAQRRLRAVADSAAPEVRAKALQALVALQNAVSAAQLERALRTRDAFAIHDLAGTLPQRLRPAVSVLNRVFQTGAQAGTALLPPGARVKMRFTGPNSHAAAAARQQAAQFVTGVTDETRRAIRTIVTRSFTEGIPPREAAQLIKPMIGLTRNQAVAVATRRSDLIADGSSAARAGAVAKRYADKLLTLRAETIARTEVIRASAAGQVAAWQESINAGRLSPRAQKIWIVTDDDRLCPICAPLDGATAPVASGGKFSTRIGKVDAPPVHPRCRCAIGVEPGPPKTGTASAPREAAEHDTMSANRRADGSWAPRRAALHQRIVTRSLKGVPKSAHPTVYMTGGGPASGKSTMLNSGKVSVPSAREAVHVDPDAIKAQLPEYVAKTKAGDTSAAAFVHEESSYLAKRVSSETASHGKDQVLDTTGDGTIESLQKKLAELRANGAMRIVANYASNDTDLAVEFSNLRGKQTGRFVPETYIRETHRQVSITLPQAVERGLFDEVTLWDTNASGNPRIVMTAGRNLPTVIHDQKLWDDFLRKAAR